MRKLLLALLLLASPAFAQTTDSSDNAFTITDQVAGACTDGANCLCDKLTNPSSQFYDANVKFCEDFEQASLNDGNTVVGSDSGRDVYGTGWATKYPGIVGSCLDTTWPAGSGKQIRGAEGTHSWSCVNIVQEGACEVSGQTDCVFDGGNALSMKFRPEKQAGIVGTATWASSTTQFGLTYASKYASGYVVDTAQKTNEFGPGAHCILGCNTNNYSGSNAIPASPQTMSSWLPRASSFFQPCSAGSCSLGTPTKGVLIYNTDRFQLSPLEADYSQSSWPLGSWGCHQMHITGWGTSNARIRRWFNGVLLVDANVKLDALSGGTSPIQYFYWNNYYNNGGDQLYHGPTMQNRLEDNWVITNGSEPVSCQQIGFP